MEGKLRYCEDGEMHRGKGAFFNQNISTYRYALECSKAMQILERRVRVRVMKQRQSGPPVTVCLWFDWCGS